MMKKFSYEWNDDIYLIHFELSSNLLHDFCFQIVRYFVDGRTIEEDNKVTPINGAFRSIVSRTSSSELSFDIIYDDDDVLKAYYVLDRAFYPTTPFYQQ